ncbi:hypothetical protein [Klebsiella pneumoniae]|nr:hypothetical protein [Klebsiella pneumoniae]MBF2726548.1 hypothetical protein [Klebsiella pneumoniae]MBF2729507.1 hypothetical protein [Klebsiella pneumoniae]MBF2741129.1 hypothetical protein [Klebsiella pneumoniae]MBF2769364.1 hypothetical protein [Klebsiella pneumoniae]MBF2785712.1 hypothetical protein [Klebsiella pneumoniae]
MIVTREKASALAIRNTRALRGHLSGQTPVDNVMNDLESVNFIQSKNAGA